MTRALRSLEELDAIPPAGSVATIGVFDGVHRGHHALIDRTVSEARAAGLASLVFTFERHPLALLAPAHRPPTLTPVDRKLELIAERGPDFALALDFTKDFAATPPESFVREVLVGRCRARRLICGGNFSFGAGGRGDVRLLQSMGPALDLDTEVVESVGDSGAPVSSTRIRDALIEGRVEEAAAMLSRPYDFRAEVVGGRRLGRTIGFPTANLRPPEDQLVPADGVYAMEVLVPGPDGARGGGGTFGGMLNAGTRPTFDGAGRAVEVHLLDFAGELVGRELEVRFLGRVREERKFAGVEELVAQLHRDAAASREILARASARLGS